MTETASLLRLMSWLSPVFPTGGFAYSAALEQAVSRETVRDRDSLGNWIRAGLGHGAQWNDAVFLAAALRAADDQGNVADISELCAATAISFERRREAVDQGTSFIEAAANWFSEGALPAPGTPVCVAVGTACGLQGIDAESAVAAWLHAFVANQLQAAIRLSVTGQRGAASLLAELEPVIAETAARAAASTLDDLGSRTVLADIAAMNHETLEPRLFLS